MCDSRPPEGIEGKLERQFQDLPDLMKQLVYRAADVIGEIVVSMIVLRSVKIPSPFIQWEGEDIPAFGFATVLEDDAYSLL